MKRKSWMSIGPEFPQLLLMGAFGTGMCGKIYIVSDAHYILSPSLIVGLPWLSDPTILTFLHHGVVSFTQGNACVPSFRSIKRTKHRQITERDINTDEHNMTRKW